MEDPVFELTDQPSSTDLETIRLALIAHNNPFLGPADHKPLAIFARSAGELAGGLAANTGRGFLRVDLLWVAPDFRNRRLGSRLLLAAEAEAACRGCRHAALDTFGFQARGFYERHGYRVFGELSGYPNGHRAFFLTKQLAGPAADSTPSQPGDPAAAKP